MYVGRFAPSPTGSLHLGSLLAAVGSFLDARSHGGRWLVRMEDLDRARAVPGSDCGILHTLEAFGLIWDGPVEYQSRRTDLYAQALSTLRGAGCTFECSCSRRELSAEESGNPGYPGTCRGGPGKPGDTATRFRVDETQTIAFQDRFQGPIALAMRTLGDVVVRRRDGLFAYQLAVVVDDAEQGVSDVVRGADLLESTGWQIALQRALRLPTPRHGHLPLLLERTGGKLSKSRRAAALDPQRPAEELLQVLRLLGLFPGAQLEGARATVLLEWATSCWRERTPPLPREIILPERGAGGTGEPGSGD